jgi:hypothetical protein
MEWRNLYPDSQVKRIATRASSGSEVSEFHSICYSPLDCLPPTFAIPLSLYTVGIVLDTRESQRRKDVTLITSTNGVIANVFWSQGHPEDLIPGDLVLISRPVRLRPTQVG